MSICAQSCRVQNAFMALCAVLSLALLMAPQAEAIVAFQHAAAGEVMVADGGWTKPCAVKSNCTVSEDEADLSHDDEPVPHHHHGDGCVQMGAIKDRGVIASPSILNARLARPVNGPELEQAGPSDIEQPPRG